ncbi:MAG: hypothetical protein EP297_15710 [Gammaproteobacteria bacterium]|nr:MAG: hypothetical protein EP297_15710 [Gammaproteobacteria bacterium]
MDENIRNQHTAFGTGIIAWHTTDFFQDSVHNMLTKQNFLCIFSLLAVTACRYHVQDKADTDHSKGRMNALTR